MNLIQKIFSRNAVLVTYIGTVAPLIAASWFPKLVAKGGWWAFGVAVTVATWNAGLRLYQEKKT